MRNPNAVLTLSHRPSMSHYTRGGVQGKSTCTEPVTDPGVVLELGWDSGTSGTAPLSAATRDPSGEVLLFAIAGDEVPCRVADHACESATLHTDTIAEVARGGHPGGTHPRCSTRIALRHGLGIGPSLGDAGTPRPPSPRSAPRAVPDHRATTAPVVTATGDMDMHDTYSARETFTVTYRYCTEDYAAQVSRATPGGAHRWELFHTWGDGDWTLVAEATLTKGRLQVQHDDHGIDDSHFAEQPIRAVFERLTFADLASHQITASPDASTQET